MSATITATPEREKIVKTFSDTNYFAKGTYKRDFVELFSTSALANYFTKTVLAPLERWRIVKQTQLSYDLRPIKVKSFSQYLTKFSKEQGWTSLWRGNAANCWMHFWQLFSQIFIFDSIKSTFNEYSFELQSNPFTKGLFERILAPVLAASVSLLITHPIDTARVRISMNYFRNPNEMLFKGITTCWSMIRLEQRSIKGIYKGYPLAILISVLHLNFYAIFRDVWNKIRSSDDKDEIVNLLMSKQSFGALLSLLLVHPLDTIKKNLQLNNQSKPVVFKNTVHVIAYYNTVHSVAKLYEGLTVSLIRQALFWPIFVTSLNYLKEKVENF